MDIDIKALPLVMSLLQEVRDGTIDWGEKVAVERSGYCVEVKRREANYFGDCPAFVRLDVRRL